MVKRSKRSKVKPAARKKTVLKKVRSAPRKAPAKVAAKPEKPAKKIKTNLSKQELGVYKEKLINLREDILNQIKDISDDTLMKSQKDISGDMSGYSLHMADMASDNYDREFSLGIVSSEREVLFEINEALKRIEEGTYGICQISGKPISKIRLNAIPHARYSKEVMEKLEKENKDQQDIQ